MNLTESAPLALICSVALEAEPVRALLRDARPVTVGRKPATRGWLANHDVVLLSAGMGKTNAAQGLTSLLETCRARGVIGFGVGGGYPPTGPGIGKIALASGEVYGDEGVAAPEGWLSCAEMGIPLVETEARQWFNHFELDEERVAAAERALRAADLDVVTGTFVTVSCCSGTTSAAELLNARFSGVCESMEGAAYAHVAEIYDVPCLEVRGISNLVGDRDTSDWRLDDAAAAAARAVEVLATYWIE